jgi:hypothetical protein
MKVNAVDRAPGTRCVDLPAVEAPEACSCSRSKEAPARTLHLATLKSRTCIVLLRRGRSEQQQRCQAERHLASMHFGEGPAVARKVDEPQ